MNDRNIVVTGVPRSGTTIVTDMLATLYTRDLRRRTRRYSEHRGCRRINYAIRDGADTVVEGFAEEAKALLADMPEPWLVKDPWFCGNRGFWAPVFADFEPVLVLVRREVDGLRRTHEKRDNVGLGPLTLEQWIVRRDQFFDGWKHPKTALWYDRVGAAANLWRNPK